LWVRLLPEAPFFGFIGQSNSSSKKTLPAEKNAHFNWPRKSNYPHSLKNRGNMYRLLFLVTICTSILFSCAAENNKFAEIEFITPTAATLSFQPNYRVGFAWFYKPPEEILLPILPQHYDFFILTHRDEEERAILQALGVRQPIPNYLLFTEIQDPGNCEKEPHGNQVAYLPGDFCRISTEHPDWFLLDAFGNRIVDDGDYYNMDPGNPGFRAFWLERALELQRNYGWEGVFLDNVEASLSKYRRHGALPAKYPEDSSLQTAVEGFLAYLQAKNIRPLYANIIAVRDKSVWLRYLHYLDGAMLENFAVDWRGNTLSPTEWADEMDVLSTSQQMGKILILVAQGHKDDLPRQQFAYASYLLINDGLAYFRYAHSSAYREVWWYTNYEIDLGKPLGPIYQNDRFWKREFEHGQVQVDTEEMTAEFNLYEDSP
jgi:hypothetical protein